MFKYKKVFLIGAGQIGSRHLQALKKVELPLDITVIDPSKESLRMAEKRYQEIKVLKKIHKVKFQPNIPEKEKIDPERGREGSQRTSASYGIDLAIIATNSHVRAEIIKSLLKTNRVRFMILEKLLFDKKKDYAVVAKLLSKNKIKAWVNCPLRLRPIYKKIKEDFGQNDHFSFRLSGYQFGLVTNTIHCLDYMVHLLKTTNFKINTNYLDRKTIPSKRKGFLELTGSLYASFHKKGLGEFVSYVSGNAPRLVEIYGPQARYVFRDQERDDEAWVSKAANRWVPKKIPFRTPLISETTAWVVEDIMKKGACGLTPYQESAQIHLAFLEPLRRFLNQNSKKKYDYYPFT